MAAYADEVLADSPAGYWKLDEASGSTCNDSSGNSKNGGAQGSYSRAATPPALATDSSSKGIQLAGTSGSYVEIADDPVFDFGDTFTMEAWIRPNSIGANSAIIGKGNGGYYYRIATNGAIEMLRNLIGSIVTSTEVVQPARWSHVVATKSGASSSKLYINGRDVTGTVNDRTITNNANVLRIGDLVTGENFPGTIAHAAVYPTALSADRVLAHFQAGVLLPSLVQEANPNPAVRRAVTTLRR